MTNTRQTTEKMLELVKDEMIDKDILIRDLLNWLSEDDVEEFAIHNNYL